MNKFLNRYNHKKVTTDVGDMPTMTESQYKKDCDMNSIVRKAGLGVPMPTREGGSYGDYSNIPDFPQMMERCEQAKRDFAALPSNIRDRFGNDPKAFFAFTLDPANAEEAIRLGIATRHVVEESAMDILKDIRKGVTAKAAEPATPGEGV